MNAMNTTNGNEADADYDNRHKHGDLNQRRTEFDARCAKIVKALPEQYAEEVKS